MTNGQVSAHDVRKPPPVGVYRMSFIPHVGRNSVKLKTDNIDYILHNDLNLE